MCHAHGPCLARRHSGFDPPNSQAFYSSVQTWLSTLEAVYRLRCVVAQWLERRSKTWARFFTPCCLGLSDDTLYSIYKPLVPSICHGLHIMREHSSLDFVNVALKM